MSKQKTERVSHSLYGGHIILDFLPNSHQYKVGKERIPNVSTIVGMLGMDDRFHRWIVEKTTDVFRSIAPIGEILDEAHVEDIAKKMMVESNRLRDQAARIGTIVHGQLEMYIKDQISGFTPGVFSPYYVGDDLADAESINMAVKSFFLWLEGKDIQWVASERLVYSKEFKYAGTLDALALINGRATLIDFKVSNNIYPKYFFQTAAYEFAIREELGYLARKQLGTHMSDRLAGFYLSTLEHGIDRIILRLDKKSGRIDPYAIAPELFNSNINSFFTLQQLRNQIQILEKSISSIRESNRADQE